MAKSGGAVSGAAQWALGLYSYVFGRNFLIGIAALMLLALSGYATWSGMRDFILGVQEAGAPVRDLTAPGGLSLNVEWLVILLVVALTFLMWLSLRETFGSYRGWRARIVTFFLYALLALWSVGFGYGFWWSLIAGPTATQEGLAGQAEDVRNAAVGVAARLEAVRARLDSVVAFSERQMAREESSGGSCGVASGRGRGPLYQARAGVRDSVAALKTNIDENWLTAVESDLSALNGEIGSARGALEGATIAERQAEFERVAAEIRGRARSIATRSDALGASYAAEMRQLAAELAVRPGEPNFACFDPSLAALLSEAAEEAAKPANVVLRDAEFNEGAAGVANAVLDLWTNLGVYFGALPNAVSSWLSGGSMDDRVTPAGEDEVEPGAPAKELTGRDLIALLATIGVDLGLFALTVLNPPPAFRRAPDSYGDLLQVMAEPSANAVQALANVVNTSLALTKTKENPNGRSLEWVRLHILNHLGHTFFVIPRLDLCTGAAARDALAMNQLVGVFIRLRMLQAIDRPRRGFFRRFRRAVVRGRSERRWREALDVASVKVSKAPAKKSDDGSEPITFTNQTAFGGSEERVLRPDFQRKAQMLLIFAGWSPNAASRPEVFALYHDEGIEPLIAVLERGEAAGVRENSEQNWVEAEPTPALPGKAT